MHCCAGPRADEVCALSALPMRARPLQFNLALALGGADDEDEATALLEAAAQQGHGGAMCNMGVRAQEREKLMRGSVGAAMLGSKGKAAAAAEAADEAIRWCA